MVKNSQVLATMSCIVLELLADASKYVSFIPQTYCRRHEDFKKGGSARGLYRDLYLEA